MKITIELTTDNAAFADGNAGREVSRILRKLATKVEDWDGETDFSARLLDFNGNKVGTAESVQ